MPLAFVIVTGRRLAIVEQIAQSNDHAHYDLNLLHKFSPCSNTHMFSD